MVALNYQNINNHPETVNNIIFFTNKHNWKEMEFPLHKKDWKKFESTIKQLLLMYYMFLKILNKKDMHISQIIF